MGNFKHSILVKLLATFLVAGFIMAFGLMIIQSRMYLKVLYTKQSTEYEDLSRNVSDAIDSLLQEYKNSVTQLSYLRQLNSGDKNEVGKELKNYISQSRQGFKKLYYVDANGSMYSSSQVVLESLQKTLNYDLPRQIAAHTPANGAAVISDVYRSSMITAETIAVSRRNPEGGTAIAEIDLGEIDNQIKLVCGTREVNYLLITETGKVVCSALPGDINVNWIAPLDSTGKWADYTGENHTRYRLFTSSGFKKCDWKLVIMIDETLTYSSLFLLIRTTLMVSAVLMLCIIGVLAVIAWHYVKPIRLLSKSIRGTDMPVAEMFLSEKRTDEIGDLSRDIGQMLDRIDRMKANQSEIQRRRFEAEKRALQSQIAPHFLYNSLNMLSSLAISGRQEQIPMAVSELVHMLLLSTEKTAPYDTLGDEVKCAQEYMDIMNLRYEGKYEISINVSDEIKNLFVIKLVLLPIIENSVYHGLVPSERDGLIIIDASVKQQNLVITVMDNGCGMDEDKAEQLLSGKQDSEIKSTGLANTNARIKLYFGDEYGLTIRSRVGIGTRITISLPIIKTVEEWEAMSNENRI